MNKLHWRNLQFFLFHLKQSKEEEEEENNLIIIITVQIYRYLFQFAMINFIN